MYQLIDLCLKQGNTGKALDSFWEMISRKNSMSETKETPECTKNTRQAVESSD